MLIKLIGHHIDNPRHIDKLIAIKGLPDDWFFGNVDRKIGGERVMGKQLLPPFTVDPENTIPREIRHLCEPREIIKIFPAIEPGKDPFVDRFTILGVRLNYLTEPGEVMWERIERYLDRVVPRDQLVPKPVVMAIDQKSGFNPHEGRRDSKRHLEFRPAEVPFVDLTALLSTKATLPEVKTVESAPAKDIEKPVVKQAETVSVTPPAAVRQEYKCPDCNVIFEKDRALRMHRMKKHRQQMAVTSA